MKINNLTKKFNDKIIFDNYCCEILDNKINFIIGESGCGKTTLLRIIAGLDKVYQGTIEGLSEKIAVVFQEPRLIPYISVYKNIKIVNLSADDEKITNLLRLVELENEGNSLPSSLSGGMKMRASIARALNYDSDIILMDEPFASLDEELKDRILPKIFNILKNKTVVIISHNLSDCEKYADNIIDLNKNILKE